VVPQPGFGFGLRTAQISFTRMVLFAAHPCLPLPAAWSRTPHPGPLPAGGERGKSERLLHFDRNSGLVTIPASSQFRPRHNSGLVTIPASSPSQA
jgi:hypothetical protein